MHQQKHIETTGGAGAPDIAYSAGPWRFVCMCVLFVCLCVCMCVYVWSCVFYLCVVYVRSLISFNMIYLYL